MKIRYLLIAICALTSSGVVAQTQNSAEQRVALTQAAVALDSKGSPALEATLRTTAINGAVDAPVINVRLVAKNVSPVFFNYVSGLVSFYDASGVRCGEGVFKLDALAQNEAAETDAPGLRVTCSAATWRVVATNLLPRAPEQTAISPPMEGVSNMVISIDGEEHPIQLGKPMVLNLGDRRRTITVRMAP